MENHKFGNETIRNAPAWVRATATLSRRLPAGRYWLSHKLCPRATAPFLAYMPERLGGFSFICDLRDSLMREVCFTGTYEPQETLLAQRLLRTGMTVVDVGANWGYFTLLAAHLVGDRGRVLSLEPDPRMFRLLQQNVQSNGLRHVKALPVAATDRNAHTTLAGYDERGGNFGLSRLAHAANEGQRQFHVVGRTLDHLLDAEGMRSVDALKMDVEGGEAAALAGLAQTLAEGRVRWLILEVHSAHLAEKGRSAEEIATALQQHGYRGWRIDHGPFATRQAAYNRTGPTLHPLSGSDTLDAWPHLLWERVATTGAPA